MIRPSRASAPYSIYRALRCTATDKCPGTTSRLSALSSELTDKSSFKQLPQTAIENWEDEYTGQVRKRFVNQARYMALGAVSIAHYHNPEDVPREPPPKVVRRSSKLNDDLLNRLKEVNTCKEKPLHRSDLQLFAKRPVWMRHSVLAQFSEADARLINLSVPTYHIIMQADE